MAKLSNLRKAIFWLQQAIREAEEGDVDDLLNALNILVEKEEQQQNETL